jgi:cysteine desulfurase/selenocysteine lyase
MLDEHDVNIRAGHHCTQPLMRRLGVAATARASFWVHNTQEDVDRLVAGIHDAQQRFGL